MVNYKVRNRDARLRPPLPLFPKLKRNRWQIKRIIILSYENKDHFVRLIIHNNLSSHVLTSHS